MENPNEERALWLALGTYVVIFAAKLAVYFASGVMALLAEALHTLSDIFISAFLLVAARFSRRRADRAYMFGYGRAQNVAALVAATLFISFTSFELYREATPRLLRPADAEYENLPLAVAVLAGSMLIAAIPLVGFWRQRERGAALKAQLLELVNDQFGLAAALAATLQRAGIADFRWHDLRHTWASWHVQNGTPLHVLQELGGWESAEMVRRYAHFSADHLAPYADRLSTLRVVENAVDTIWSQAGKSEGAA